MPWRLRRKWSSVLVLVAVVLAGCTDDTTSAGSASTDPTSTTAQLPGSQSPTAPSTTPSTPLPPSSAPNATAVPTLPAGDDVTVGSIVDGDTFRTSADERVRLLNIDTPEPTQNECWASEATQRLRELVPPGTPVRLVYDVERYDRYGRTLAHVYRLHDGLWVNKQLVEDGAAFAYVLRPNDTHYPEIRAAADAAARDGRGLWGACADRPPAGARNTGSGGGSLPGGATATTDAARASCDPAYPTVCIPSPPPDLDCGDITARRFPVLPPDPHRFDGGGDGIGCERD